MNVVITGASRGIGLELVKAALGAGSQVLAVARQPKAAKDLMALTAQFPGQLQVAAADLAGNQCAAEISAACASWPQIDLLINNAGIYAKDDSPTAFQASFQVNSIAPFLITQTLLAKLKRSPAAKIVQVTSKMGSIEDNTSGGSAAYRASKAALNMLNKCIAVENQGLTTIVIHPGWVKTDMGGSSAPVEVADSARGIWQVIQGLKPKDSGKFLDFQGETIPW